MTSPAVTAPAHIGASPRLRELASVAASEAAGGGIRRIGRDEVFGEPLEQPPRTVPAPRIPARFEGVTLGTFTPDPHFPDQEAALRGARRFVELAIAGEGPMLALLGPPGVGKSLLLYAVAGELYSAGLEVTCESWYSLADELRYGDGMREAHEIRRRLLRSRILLLDEVRATANTGFDDTELTKLVCHHWDHKHAVLLTGNVERLEDLVGDHVASRVRQFTITGRDMRKRRQERPE